MCVPHMGTTSVLKILTHGACRGQQEQEHEHICLGAADDEADGQVEAATAGGGGKRGDGAVQEHALVGDLGCQATLVRREERLGALELHWIRNILAGSPVHGACEVVPRCSSSIWSKKFAI